MQTWPGWLAADWRAPEGVHAGCSTRLGGVSAAPYGVLNVGAHVADDPLLVARNRALLAERLGLPAAPRWLDQVHGTRVLRLSAADAPAPAPPAGPGSTTTAPTADGAAPPTADASVTDEPGVVCAVMTADCLPVLFASADGRAVGAAHAGWRGLEAGVLERIVEALRELSGAPLSAWLGPAIGPAAFEVGPEVRAAFVARSADAVHAFRPGRGDRWFADLPLLARQRLAAVGVTEVTDSALCTHSDPERFFSYRRDGRTGRQVSLIWRAEPTR